MIAIHTIEYWLTRWGRWAALGNKSPLGMKIGSYAERIGAGSGMRETDYSPDTELEVLAVDRAVREMPKAIQDAIKLQYCVPGPVKSKLSGQSTTHYYGALNMAKAALLDTMNSNPEYTKAFQNKSHGTVAA